jgi:hypothetical protein
MNASGSRQWTVVDSCAHGNETSSFIEGGNFLDSVNVSFSRLSLLHEASQLVS